MTHTDPADRHAALQLLRELGAPQRLVRHGEIVSEVAALISDMMSRHGVEHDAALVVVGAVLHDAGKVIHPEELVGPGGEDGAAGERLLLHHGLSARLARVCRTHGSWDLGDIELEDLLVALADHLWKGERGDEIERLIVERVAPRLRITRWEAFLRLDPVFEEIAADGPARLARASR